MTAGVLHNKEDILNAIVQKRGVIRAAAQLMKVNHKTFYDWMERDPEVADAVKKAREQNHKDRADNDEEILNLAYESIYDLIRGRDVTATIFALKCRAKWSDKAGDEAVSTTKIETVNYYQAKDG